MRNGLVFFAGCNQKSRNWVSDNHYPFFYKFMKLCHFQLNLLIPLLHLQVACLLNTLVVTVPCRIFMPSVDFSICFVQRQNVLRGVIQMCLLREEVLYCIMMMKSVCGHFGFISNIVLMSSCLRTPHSYVYYYYNIVVVTYKPTKRFVSGQCLKYYVLSI